IDFPIPAAIAGLADASALERVAKQIKRGSIALRHVEGRRDLPSPAVVASRTAYEHEAGFSQREPGQEAPKLPWDRFDEEPFLLITCTRHIVTVTIDPGGSRHE